MGLEPMTTRLRALRSTNWARSALCSILSWINLWLYCLFVGVFILDTHLCTITISFEDYLRKFSNNADYGARPMTTRLRALRSTTWGRSALYSILSWINLWMYCLYIGGFILYTRLCTITIWFEDYLTKFSINADHGARTHDHKVKSLALYQLS